MNALRNIGNADVMNTQPVHAGFEEPIACRPDPNVTLSV